MPVGLAWGALVSLGLTLIGSGIVAFLVDRGTMPVEGIGYGAMGILVISALSGALTAWSKIKRLRLQVCLMSGGIYYLMLLGMTMLFFGGHFRGMGVTALMVACGSILAILGGFSKGRGGKRSYRRGVSR
jgi:hypothetical protein